MGGKDTTTKTTSENKPWSVGAPYFESLYKKAQEAFNQTNGETFGGDMYADPNATQRQGLAQLRGVAPALSAGAQPLQDLALSQIRGDWLNPDSNPYIKDVAGAALKPVQAGFDANRLNIDDRAISQGAYGGARQDLQQNKALDDFTKTSGDITSGIYGQNYANERQIQQGSGGMLELSNLLRLAEPTTMLSAGATEQGWDQGAMDAALKKWQMGQQAPWSGMGELSNILTAGGFGSNEGTSTAPKPNPILGILQGLMGGASTGASMGMGIGGLAAGAGLSAFAPWMLPIAALGGLAGGLG